MVKKTIETMAGRSWDNMVVVLLSFWSRASFSAATMMSISLMPTKGAINAADAVEG